MSEETANNIITKQEPLGDLNFSSMIPEAAFAAAMIAIIVLASAGIGAALRAHDPKRAVAIGLITGSAVVLCVLGIMYLQTR